MTTSDRDTLTAYLTSFVEREAWADTAEEAAEYIESALRWRPPAQVITTAAELDALPVGSIVLAEGKAWTLHWTGNGWSECPSCSITYCAEDLLDYSGESVTVLYVPTEEAGRG